jgi:hypothetical protein
MESVTGIGGFFFAAQDPEALTSWYARHLGVDGPPATYEQQPWRQQSGPTVLAPAGADAPHLAGRPWALNFRVADLDAMVAQLQAAGIDVEVHQETYPNGRFADLVDPEGNPIQLWQPAGPDAR